MCTALAHTPPCSRPACRSAVRSANKRRERTRASFPRAARFARRQATTASPLRAPMTRVTGQSQCWPVYRCVCPRTRLHCRGSRTRRHCRMDTLATATKQRDTSPISVDTPTVVHIGTSTAANVATDAPARAQVTHTAPQAGGASGHWPTPPVSPDSRAVPIDHDGCCAVGSNRGTCAADDTKRHAEWVAGLRRRDIVLVRLLPKSRLLALAEVMGKTPRGITVVIAATPSQHTAFKRIEHDTFIPASRVVKCVPAPQTYVHGYVDEGNGHAAAVAEYIAAKKTLLANAQRRRLAASAAAAATRQRAVATAPVPNAVPVGNTGSAHSPSTSLREAVTHGFGIYGSLERPVVPSTGITAMLDRVFGARLSGIVPGAWRPVSSDTLATATPNGFASAVAADRAFFASRRASRQPPWGATTTTQRARETPPAPPVMLNTECTICMTNGRDTSLVPCGHVLCSVCASKCSSVCPICRERVSGHHRIYM
jgi:Zinc finger, C3HC4 type (RING finger)